MGTATGCDPGNVPLLGTSPIRIRSPPERAFRPGQHRMDYGVADRRVLRHQRWRRRRPGSDDRYEPKFPAAQPRRRRLGHL